MRASATKRKNLLREIQLTSIQVIQAIAIHGCQWTTFSNVPTDLKLFYQAERVATCAFRNLDDDCYLYGWYNLLKVCHFAQTKFNRGHHTLSFRNEYESLVNDDIFEEHLSRFTPETLTSVRVGSFYVTPDALKLLSNYSKLENLDLTKARIIPELLTPILLQLPNLKTLHVPENIQLQEISTTLGKMKNLTSIQLHADDLDIPKQLATKIKGHWAHDVDYFPKVDSLRLCSILSLKSLYEADITIFTHLSKLQLDINHQISEPLPADITKLTNLTFLSTSYPLRISHCRALVKSLVEFHGRFDEQCLSKWRDGKKVESYSLRRCTWPYMDHNIFFPSCAYIRYNYPCKKIRGLPSLEHLHVSRCDEKFQIGHLPLLRTLSITSISFFRTFIEKYPRNRSPNFVTGDFDLPPISFLEFTSEIDLQELYIKIPKLPRSVKTLKFKSQNITPETARILAGYTHLENLITNRTPDRESLQRYVYPMPNLKVFGDGAEIVSLR
eukprot:TRINITY_DN184_c0_g1_i15.p1 TRINITY_DN184_c0_g1~~TRINITY_DN184_c0_g1_i15.p1  ORF type:complete len:499 (+),score=43.47 TRINITY_DN184_c0_g1_i15:413-1909(+)